MDRRILINKLISDLKLSSYLEIGTGAGDCFCFIKAGYLAGVDIVAPSDKIMGVLGVNKKYYQTASSDFLKNTDRRFDIIHVNGAITFDESYQDIEGALRLLPDSGVLIVNDVFLPKNNKAHEVWKSIIKFRSKHKEYAVFTFSIGGGISIIRKNISLPYEPLDIPQNIINSLTEADYGNNRNMMLNLTDYYELDKIIQLMLPSFDFAGHFSAVFGDSFSRVISGNEVESE